MVEARAGVPDIVTAGGNDSSARDVDPGTVNASDHAPIDAAANCGESNSKRAREKGTEQVEEENGGVKKQRVDKSLGEQGFEMLEGNEAEEGPVNLGPKKFQSSVEMFDYFYKFLHYWPPNLNVNKYEHMVLLDLLKKGHLELGKKIGNGMLAFQVRYHPHWKSRCFFLVRNDDSVDDFSFRKCVNNILPLPENMQIKADVNKALGGKAGNCGSGRGKGGGHGRGRGKRG